MQIKLLRRLALFAIAALMLAACGGGAAEDEAAGTTAPTGGEPTAADTGTEMATDMSTEMSTGSTEGATGSAAQNEGDGTLTIGTLLPETGSLAFLGPPEIAGAALAVQQINEAGGVLDNDVELIPGDSGDTTTDIANQTVDRELNQGVDVIVGAASSAVSFTVIDKITGAGVVHFSPANTSPDFTDYADRGLYFRTAPSDVLQGRILGQSLLEEGAQTVGILALQDPYGEGLADNAEQTITESGGQVVEKIIYDPQAQTFDTEIQKLVSADPDAIAVIGFDESARILQTMIEQGIGPSEKIVYGVDGNIGNALAEAVGEDGALAGMKGTLPGAVAEGEFKDQLLEVDPQLKDFSYAAETYDAVIVSALAAVAAESDAGEALAQELPGVTEGGTKCMTFEECKQLLESGEDIDYDGESGPIEMNEAGDPTTANFQILEYPEGYTVQEAKNGNAIEVVDTQEASL
ncbi:MAG: ABC transporter substrate-binding protein [Egibacteraceae bacterium]